MVGIGVAVTPPPLALGVGSTRSQRVAVGTGGTATPQFASIMVTTLRITIKTNLLRFISLQTT
jgi:hypothetical protein